VRPLSGKHLVSAGGDHVRLWDYSGKELASEELAAVSAIAVCPDGSCIVAAAPSPGRLGEWSLTIWDARLGARRIVSYGRSVSAIVRSRGVAVKTAGWRSAAFTVHRRELGRTADVAVDDRVAEIAKTRRVHLRVLRAPTGIGGHHVHHGRGFVSRNRRRGPRRCRTSIGSRAASAVEFSFVSAVAAIEVSGSAPAAGPLGGVSRSAARARGTRTRHARGGCTRRGRLGIASGGTRSSCRK
jgi:hypothetical protein